MTNKYIAVLDGKQVGTRTSQNRTYTHVLVGRLTKDPEEYVGALTWCGSLDLARKQLASYARAPHWTDLKIVEATKI